MDANTTIIVFVQSATETICEAWEQYKSMLHKYLNHGFDNLTQIHIFCNGLQPQPKLLLDATAGGSLMGKSVEDAIFIIDRMALNDPQVQYNRNTTQRKPEVLELEENNTILTQNNFTLKLRKN